MKNSAKVLFYFGLDCVMLEFFTCAADCRRRGGLRAARRIAGGAADTAGGAADTAGGAADTAGGAADTAGGAADTSCHLIRHQSQADF